MHSPLEVDDVGGHVEPLLAELVPLEHQVVPVSCIVFGLSGTSCERRARPVC